MTNVLSTKQYSILHCFRFLKEAKIVPFIYPALKSPMLIRNDGLISEKSKAKKKICEYLMHRSSYEYLKYGS